MILTTGKIVFVTDSDDSDCYIENLRTEYNTNLYCIKIDRTLAQGGLSVAGRCRCLTKDSNTSIEKEGYIPYSLQA